MKKYLILFFIIMNFVSISHAEIEPLDDKWTIIYSNYITLYLEKNIDLKEFSKKIELKQSWITSINPFFQKSQGINDIENKLDGICYQVQKILGIYTSNLKVKIYVYSKLEDVESVYKEIFNKDFSNHRGEKDIVSFYRHKDETIYVFVDQLSIGILAHELAHAVISNSFEPVPPAGVQEILAMYVDKSLR